MNRQRRTTRWALNRQPQLSQPINQIRDWALSHVLIAGESCCPRNQCRQPGKESHRRAAIADEQRARRNFQPLTPA